VVLRSEASQMRSTSVSLPVIYPPSAFKCFCDRGVHYRVCFRCTCTRMYKSGRIVRTFRVTDFLANVKGVPWSFLQKKESAKRKCNRRILLVIRLGFYYSRMILLDNNLQADIFPTETHLGALQSRCKQIINTRLSEDPARQDRTMDRESVGWKTPEKSRKLPINCYDSN